MKLGWLRHFSLPVALVLLMGCLAAAAPFFGYDPIFLQGLTGAIGAASVIVGSLLGLLWGTEARREKRREARSAAA